MSLRNIELQIALPKTAEIGKLQNSFQQRTNIEQSVAMSEMKKTEIKKRKSTEKSTKSELQEQNTSKKQKKDVPKSDPNKGRFIDIKF